MLSVSFKTSQNKRWALKNINGPYSLTLTYSREILTGFGMISMNRHYEPLPLKELIDPSMSNWCHHSPFILNQGRTVWWNPNKGMVREIDVQLLKQLLTKLTDELLDNLSINNFCWDRMRMT